MDEEKNLQAQAKATEWLEEKWKGSKNCPICLNNSWSITEPIEMRIFAGGAFFAGGNLYPAFQVICTTCGHVILFNSIVAGITARPEPEPESRPTTEGTTLAPTESTTLAPKDEAS